MSNLTEKQKQYLRDVVKLGDELADPFGQCQSDLAAVCEMGSTISYQLEQAFPFLIEEMGCSNLFEAKATK